MEGKMRQKKTMWRKKILFSGLFIGLIVLPTLATAAIIVKYDFTGSTSPSNTANYVAGSDYGAGSTVSSHRLWDDVGNPGWSYGAQDDWLDGDDYMSFSLTIDQGYSLILQDLTFDCTMNGSGSPFRYDVKYSTDGSSFTSIGVGGMHAVWRTMVEDNNGVPIPGLSGEVYFRIYASDSSTGDWWWQDDVIVNGSIVSTVPIPSAVWLLGSAFIGLVGFRSKFRKE